MYEAENAQRIAGRLPAFRSLAFPLFILTFLRLTIRSKKADYEKNLLKSNALVTVSMSSERTAKVASGLHGTTTTDVSYR